MTTQHTEQSEREELKPCPFCGAGETSIVENGKVWTGMKYSEPTSVSVRHHCTPTKGQPSRMLERVGKDRESAISAWNTRAPLAATPAAGEPVAYMWQHDETGRTGFVDAWQIQNGWQEQNPRCKVIGPLYTHPQPQQVPLTPEAIYKAVSPILDPLAKELGVHLPFEKILDAARAIEAAQGIGKSV